MAFPVNAYREVKISLHQLIDDLLRPLLTLVSTNRLSPVNTVSPKIYITTDIYPAISIMSEILESVMRNALESNIIVSAKELHSGVIELHIKDENCYDAYALALGLQNAMKETKKAGGQLFITHQNRFTTITFRFVAIGL